MELYSQYISFCALQDYVRELFANFSNEHEQIYNCSRTSRTIIPELELETNSTHYSRTRDEQALNLVREEIFCSCSCSWFGSHICSQESFHCCIDARTSPSSN